jgi:hypothetical protein
MKTPKPKYYSDYNSPYLYQYYKKNYKKMTLSRETYKKIMYRFFELLKQEIYKGLVFKMPFKLGFIKVSGSTIRLVFGEDDRIDLKKSHIAIDHNETKKLHAEFPELKGKKVMYHDNEHTDGINYFIKWNFGGKIRNITVYEFRPCRNFSRGLAKHLKNNFNTHCYDF